jgi:predicted DNA binding CopG/RHH family protein
MSSKLKPIPRFKTEAEERRFWETHDSTEYVDWSKARGAQFPNVKLPTTSISLRLPQGLLQRIKIAANKRDVPYQSLIKVWLAERVDADERKPDPSPARRAMRRG